MREGGGATDAKVLLEPLLALHDRIRDAVLRACEQQSSADLSAVASDDTSPGDTIYAIDRVGEAALEEGLAEIALTEPLVLVAEGLAGGKLVLPRGTSESGCRWRILMDPIDGTRGLMFQKRSAWILTGVAPNKGDHTRLRDITLAVQTEIPLLKQHLGDQLWAVRGGGTQARRFDRVSGRTAPLTLRPSRAGTIEHGFSTVVRFFPGARDVLAAVDDDLVLAVLGPPPAGRAACFEDQYASTGGQLYELMAGHDRFIADLRPLTMAVLAERGLPQPLCCHPYDVCASLIAEELGVVVTDAFGAPLDAPFELESDVAWIGYANAQLRAVLEPQLRLALRQRKLS
ncbi:MAG TPA: hypothetical protein VFT29_12645 [Gemmatimonadaceae bacterium]|nr:hypothetical protein [Gemmatimonadaceae bacterium]